MRVRTVDKCDTDYWWNISQYLRQAILAMICLVAGLFIFPGVAHADRTINSATLNGTANVTVSPGQSITVDMNVTVGNPGGPANRAWRTTGWLISTTPPGAVNCADTADLAPVGTYSDTFSVTAPPTAGIYTAYFIAYNDAGCAGGDSAIFTAGVVTVNNPVPTTTSISPATKVIGDAAFTMTVNGTNFVTTSVVQINGVDRVTTYFSPTQLTVAIPASDMTVAGTFAITVFNPAPGGGTSNAQIFTVVSIGGFNAFETGVTSASAIDGPIRTKVSGIAFSLDIVALNLAKDAQTALTGTVTVSLLGNATSGIALDANGCPTSSTLLQTFDVNMATTRQTVTFAAVANAWRDVRVRMSFAGPPAVTSCSRDNFAIRPANLSLVIATDTDSVNAGMIRALANSSATGGNVHKAGRDFTIRATARNASNAITPGYDGNPTVRTIVCTLPTPTCVNGTLTPGTWSAASGVVTTITATYSEAGSFNLALEDQTFASVDAADGSTLAERTIPQDAAVTVGRFVPDSFEVIASNVPQFRTFNSTDVSCTAGAPAPVRSFTYIGQSFGYETVPVTLINALNASGVVTRNYSLNLWKVLPANVTQTYTTVQPRDVDNVNAPTVTATAGNAGTGTVTTNTADTLAFTRNLNMPQAPFSANITLNVNVADDSENGVSGNGIIGTSTGAVFSNIAFNSGNTFRYGRLKLSNAHGSELLRLPVPSETQYWNGSFFVTNTADHCTTISANKIDLVPGTCTSVIANPVFLSGRGNLRLAASNAKCSAVLTINLPPDNKSYLQGNWSGSNYDQNPTSKVTFGLFKGKPIIYMREMY